MEMMKSSHFDWTGRGVSLPPDMFVSHWAPWLECEPAQKKSKQLSFVTFGFSPGFIMSDWTSGVYKYSKPDVNFVEFSFFIFDGKPDAEGDVPGNQVRTLFLGNKW